MLIFFHCVLLGSRTIGPVHQPRNAVGRYAATIPYICNGADYFLLSNLVRSMAVSLTARLKSCCSFADDIVWIILGLCDLRTILQCRMTSRSCFMLANSVLRDRFRGLVRPFFSDVTAFSDLLRKHGAVISGSLALYYLVPSEHWFPNDMDIYVSYEEFPRFIHVVDTHPSVLFIRTPQSTVSTSDSLDIAEVRRYLTPSNRAVDVIRSRRSNPAFPLPAFWTSLLVNYVTPDSIFSAFPRMVFNGKGYIKEFGMTSRDEAAMLKYKARKFRGDESFSFAPELWGTWMDPFYWQKDFLSDRKALVVDLRRRACDPITPMPIIPIPGGWKLVFPFPIRAHRLLFRYILCS